MSRRDHTEVTVVLHRCRERDEATGQVSYSGYDISWPDGRPMSIGLRRFCQHGTRLLVGRRHNPDTALVKLSLYPVAGLEAPLTRPGPGIRCRRFYTVRTRDLIRLYFFTGTQTEVAFDPEADEEEVIRWLQAERMRPGEPFWFDLASQTILEGDAAAAFYYRGRAAHSTAV
jgi:hypothetical protein